MANMSEYNDTSLFENDNDTYPGAVDLCLPEEWFQKFLPLYIHPIICMTGLLGNILVIITYSFYKKAKSMTDVYLLNVAVADILFVIALPLIIYNQYSGWTMGDFICKLLRGTYSVNLYSGILLLACISGDRYLAIVQARRSFRIRSSTLVYSHITCFAVWLLALIISMPTFIYSSKYSTRQPYYSIGGFLNATGELEYYDDLPQVDNVCFFMFEDNETASLMKVLVPSTQMVVGFFLPLVVMGFCYTSVLITLLRAKNFQRHKAVRVVLTVVVVFVLCHLPYNLALLYHTITQFEQMECSHSKSIMATLTVTEMLAYLHCCLNPLLYAFVGVKFRNHFRKILEDLWCIGKGYITTRRPSSWVTSEMCLSSRRSVDGSFSDKGASFSM
ncbi:C-C chemokine receptor type 6a isoform X2 [Denticeps clupeoides]|nr:C-C chemokine receptor type 6-like isoform X2 [Denticeps clupeoides]